MSNDINNDREAGSFEPSADARSLFQLMWQLESWLREMVYVELRAHVSNWEQSIAGATGKPWPPHSMSSDKRLSHMATRHEAAMSYLTFGELQKVIFAYWTLFDPYFPPKELFKARLEEISQIRHRVAHFREPHENDLARTKLLLQDLDHGVARFCSSYNQEKATKSGIADPVSDHFAHNITHDYQVELSASNDKWHHGQSPGTPTLGVGLRYGVRPWAPAPSSTIIGVEGVVYMAKFIALRPYCLDYDKILKATQEVHANCIHVRLSDGGRGRVDISIPSIAGEKIVRETIAAFWEGFQHARGRRETTWDELEQTAKKWPEYVIGPSNPLLFPDEAVEAPMFFLG